ncbi:response regulator [Aggregicoccus sp. 17bor-14]|uniref:two-component regulator propeller domain-containing protein n=1 Tax=Myxococcaceae TaxID=31 RepID=UPI00129CAF48|nr:MULTISPECIES: two-component regulator propeller domain-containing protein [Myxococcaceae]MBF5043224.1 response regulator [Simulacricoccus sp. 17bor-14]MRI88981.1 response regulator [Aggregicoccus sp. 17bor-14]
MASLLPSLVAAVLLALPAPQPPLQARALPSTSLPLLQRSWTQDEGLPQNGVAAVAQTQDGYLWVGTQEGLARFDGARWEVFDTARGLPCNDVLALYAEGARLWVGTEGCGLVRYEGGRFHALPTNPGGADDSVQAFLPAADGGLWVATDHGLAHRVGETFQYVEGLAQDDVSSLAQGPGGVLWVGTRSGGVVRLTPGGSNGSGAAPALERLGAAAGLGSLQVEALLADAQGVLWAGARDGLYRLAPGEARFTPVAALAGRKVSRLLEDSSGDLWVGTEDGGVLRRHAGQFAQAGSPALGRMFVSALYEDREHSLWVGTSPGGVHQLREARVQVLGTPEGLAHDVVWSVYEDRAGAVWLGTEDAGLHRLKDGQLTRYGEAQGVPNGIVFGLSEDREGGLWVATSQGAARFDGEHFRRYGTKDGLPSELVFYVHEDPRGDLWFGTDVALARLEAKSGRFTVYGAAAGISRNGVNHILDAPEGGLWLGTPAGLVRFDPGQDGGRVVESYGPKEGLAGRSVGALAQDRERPGVLWLGTEQGLVRLERGVLRSVGVKEGLFDPHILSVLDDGQGSLWLSSNHGIARVAKAELEEVLAGTRERVHSETFGRSDGLRAVECNSASRAASLRARDGALWFPTISGAVRIDPARQVRPLPTPPLVIEQVLSGGHPVEAQGGLSGEAPDIELHYAALTFVDPERVRYRYKLEGYDPDWVDAGSRRQAFYTNLPAGQYRFRVMLERAGGAGAQAAPVEATFAFRRRPRLLETPAFWGAALLALAGLVALAFRLRVRQLRERERELTERVEERTGELAEANRALIRVAEESAEIEESLRRLIEQLPIAVTVYVDERATYANDAALRLLGYERLRDLQGQPLHAHRLPEDEAEARERAPGVQEARLRRRDGSVAVVELSGVPLTFGGRAAYVSVARDVTQAQQMEARLRLSDRMASVGTLAAGVAHEINNPLAFVVSNLRYGAVELRAWEKALEAGRTLELDEVREVAQALDEACHGADRVKHIVKDLKTFSRGGETPSRIDLRPVLESSLSMANNEVRHRARLRKELGEVPYVMASEAKLGQVFLNLVVNAAQAIREGAADQNEISVRTSTDAAGRAVVEVRDSGCGIPPENLKLIFDPFFTTKPVGEGTGLGLSICHSIVTGLGGDIHVESRPGEGSLFRVVLPAATDEQPARPVPVPSAPGPRGRILVVDDEPLVAKSLVRLLGTEHHAEAVTSARTALERLVAGEHFDLVFCDVMMPEMSGRDFWEALGHVQPALQGRVVFVTGGAFTPEARRFLEQVAGRVVAKPFDPGEVKAVVRERLARRAA